MNDQQQSRADALTTTKLPDGSGFAVASLPLPQDHWLYASRCAEWDSERDTSADTPHPILTHAQRDAVVAAVRYAIRSATMCGQDMDFDPDALVLNAVYALCGPFSSLLEDNAASANETGAEAAAIPAGWKLVRVNEHFDALIAALERAESKGYLPDSMREEWENFACDENVTQPAQADALAEAREPAKVDTKARMDWAAGILRKLPPLDPTYSIISILDDHDREDRDEVLHSIRVFADMRATQALFTLYGAPADAGEAQPSLTNPLTPFGMLVRALRIVSGTLLGDMAKHLGCSAAMLSAVEFGRRPLTDAMIADTAAYFSSVGIPDTLHALSAASRARALLAPTQQPSGKVTDDDKVCAERYRWMAERFLGADFEWGVHEDGYGGIPALIIKLPENAKVWGSLDLTIDAARAQGGES